MGFFDKVLSYDIPWGAVGPTLVIFGIWSIGLLWFAIRTAIKGRYVITRVQELGGTRILGSWLMEYGYWMIHSVSNFFVKMRLSPDLITLLSLFTALTSAVLFYVGWFGLGGWLMIFAGLFDVLDGLVARAIGVASEAGEFFDSVIDRYAELAGFIALLGYYFPQQPLCALIVGLALLASIMITYNRAKGEAQGITGVPSGYMRRHERCFIMGVGTAISPIAAVWIEPGAARPVFHVAVGAMALVAILGNYSAIKLAVEIRRRLRIRDGITVPSRPVTSHAEGTATSPEPPITHAEGSPGVPGAAQN